ncbi:CPK22, partial [Symbiodinium sp. KB8]
MIIVCFGVFVFITRNLRDTITPLCWAAFFAVPSTLLISYLDRLINTVMSRLVQLWHRMWGSRRIECPEFVHFVSALGDSHICLDNAAGTAAFLRKVNTPCIGCGAGARHRTGEGAHVDLVTRYLTAFGEDVDGEFEQPRTWPWGDMRKEGEATASRATVPEPAGRHKERRHTGGQADELVKFAAKINPELRFYIGKFPGEVRRLLAEGKKVYKSILEKKQWQGGDTAQTAELRHDPRLAKDTKQAKKKNKTRKEKKEKTKTEKHDTMEVKDPAKDVTQHDGMAAGDPDHEVDWGNSDTDTKPQALATSSQDMGGSHGSDDDMVLSDVLSHETSWLLKLLQVLRLESCFRRRVKIVSLSLQDGTEGDSLGPEVNRLVQGWTYYASSAGTREFAFDGEEGLTTIRLELFLDASEQYAAVIPTSPPTTRSNINGTLEMDKSSSLSWLVALLLTLLLVSAGMWFFIECITLGVQSFTNNLDDYKKGVEDFLNLVKPILPESTWKELQQKITSFLTNELGTLASQLASSLESLSFQALMFFVYLFFWIFEPLPVSSPVAEVFKSYLLMKTFICLLFSALMSVLLMCLQCKIWSLFFVLTFLLNFIPEIGAIASAVLTVPAILFDGHLPMERRLENLIWLVIMGTAIKVFTGNVVEVQMYATMGGQFMRMHPVIIMALIMLFSSLLGITGMFLAVPSMAAVKYYLVSTDMPDQFQHPLLVAIEGDATGPHKNFVDQKRIQQHAATTSNAASTVELGYPALVTGTAELVEGQRRLSSEVGTRIFWAPEIFGKSYGLKVDVWALGIIMYGLLDGRFPFKDEHDIKTKEPKYPKRLEPLCQDFIRVMLLKEEDVRATAEDVMVHRWLSNFAGCSQAKDQSEDFERSSESRDGRRRSSESSEVPVHQFEHEEPNCSVAERRRELMERLNNEHTKGPAAVDFLHCASLTEFSVPDRRLPGAHWLYQWWDRIQAENLGPRSSEGQERTLEEVSRELDRSPHIVGKMLQDYNIDIAKFGVGEAKTLEQLASEVQNGSVRLMLDATTHKKLVRVVDVVLLRLYSSSRKDRLLIEVGEQYPDGRRRAASRLPGTKKFPHESSQETAFRVLQDLLGVTARAANFAFEDTEVYEEEMDSPSFPGVRTVYRKEIMEGHLKETDEATALRIGLLEPEGTDWSVQERALRGKGFPISHQNERLGSGRYAVRIKPFKGASSMPELLPLRFLLLWLLHSGVTLAWATKSTLVSVKALSRNDPVEHLGLTVQHRCPVCLPAALRPTSCELSQAVSGFRGNMEAHEAILLSVVLPKLLWSAPLVPAVERKLVTSLPSCVHAGAVALGGVRAVSGLTTSLCTLALPVLSVASLRLPPARVTLACPTLRACVRHHAWALSLCVDSARVGLWLKPRTSACAAVSEVVRRACFSGRQPSFDAAADGGHTLHMVARALALDSVNRDRWDAEGIDEVDPGRPRADSLEGLADGSTPAEAAFTMSVVSAARRFPVLGSLPNPAGLRSMRCMIQAQIAACTIGVTIADLGASVPGDLDEVLGEHLDAQDENDENMKVYWSVPANDAIMRSTLNGSDLDLSTIVIFPLRVYRIYWSAQQAIQRAWLPDDSGAVEDWVNASAGLRSPMGLALDEKNRVLYWADQTLGKIQRKPLDGGPIEDVADNIEEPSGVAVDAEGGQVFFLSFDLGIVYGRDIDLSDDKYEVATTYSPYGIVVDATNEKLYWSSRSDNEIQRWDIGFFGQAAETFLSGLNKPMGLTIEPASQGGLK